METAMRVVLLTKQPSKTSTDYKKRSWEPFQVNLPRGHICVCVYTDEYISVHTYIYAWILYMYIHMYM